MNTIIITTPETRMEKIAKAMDVFGGFSFKLMSDQIK
jgi:hypothetical protein